MDGFIDVCFAPSNVVYEMRWSTLIINAEAVL